MKKQYIILSLLLTAISNPFSAFGAEKKDDTPAPIVLNDSLKKLVEIEGVNSIYKECESNYSMGTGDTRAEKVLNCLWDKIKPNKELAKKVQAAYAEELKKDKAVAKKTDKESPSNTISIGASRAPASSENLSDKKLVVQTNYSADPAIQALSEFYGKKLDEILDPKKALTEAELKNGTILTVDHSKFIELYKTELGRTIISAFTSYCLDSDVDADYKIETSKIKDNRKNNLASISKADLNTNSKDSDKWKKCIGSVAKKCVPTAAIDPDDETSKRACLVVDYVEAARRNLIVADSQIEDYKLLDARNGTLIVSNTKEVTDLKKSSNDSILEMTSKDVSDSLKKPLEKEQTAFEECFKGGAIISADACKKYLSTNKDANTMAMVEMGMRKIAQEENLKEELKSDDKVRSYLSEEGYSKDEITTLTKDKTSIENVKKEILDRYAAQKEAIIKEMAAKIENKTASTDGRIDAKDAKNVDKLSTIRDEMTTRSKDLENLVKFNNIVSSYLEVEDKSKKDDNKSRNTASLYAEATSMDEKEGKALQENINKAKLTDQRGKSAGADLSVKDVNGALLKYDIKKKD